MSIQILCICDIILYSKEIDGGMTQYYINNIASGLWQTNNSCFKWDYIDLLVRLYTGFWRVNISTNEIERD